MMSSTAEGEIPGASASADDKRKSLERKLQCRPTVDELIQHNVLKQSTEGISRTLAAKLREFEKHKMEDALNRKLANRPSRERLVEMNLLRGENVSPAFYTKQQELAKRAIEDKLNKKLAARPTKEELVEQHKLVEGDPRRIAAQRSLQRKMIESNLNVALSGKYGTRFSGRAREAEPLVAMWSKRRASLDGTDDSAAAAAAAASSASASPEDSDKSDTSSVTSLSDAPSAVGGAVRAGGKLTKTLSSQSIQHKSHFIRSLQDEGRFVCVNCCSEDFQGLELSSPRYSYKDFYGEEDWKELGLKPPRHCVAARLKSLCNACFGVCSCGAHIGTDDVCDNCGSLRPLSGDAPRRAPDYRRPRSLSVVEQRRVEQLQRHASANPAILEQAMTGERVGRRVHWSRDAAVPAATADEPADEADDDNEPVNVDYCHFQRYRFRNSFNDDCYLFHPSDESYESESEGDEGDRGATADGEEDGEEEPEVWIEDTDQQLRFSGRSSGFYFCEPDADGNIFVIVLGDKSEDPAEYISNTTRVYLHDARRNLFYFADKSVGRVFCYDPEQKTVTAIN